MSYRLGLAASERRGAQDATADMAVGGPWSLSDREELYKWIEPSMYIGSMDVPVTELRAHLSEWLDRVRGGEEVIVTDRGVPVARMLGMTATATLQRLAADGVIGRDSSARRPMATGRSRPRPRQSVSGIISEQRG
jgi:prevent-host-death family protein